MNFIRVHFPTINKNNHLADYIEQGKRGKREKCLVKKVIEVDYMEYKKLATSLLSDNPIYEQIGGAGIPDEVAEQLGDEKLKNIGLLTDEDLDLINKHGWTEVVQVKCTNGSFLNTNEFFVNTEGYDYARYVGLR